MTCLGFVMIVSEFVAVVEMRVEKLLGLEAKLFHRRRQGGQAVEGLSGCLRDGRLVRLHLSRGFGDQVADHGVEHALERLVEHKLLATPGCAVRIGT